MTVSESLQIDFNDNLYSSSQASRLSNNFNIAHHGNTLQIMHPESKMKVTVQKNGEIQIQAPENIKRVIGLCGNNNNNREDDRSNRYNQQLTSTKRFLDYWQLSGYEPCVKKIENENLTKAKEICGLIRFPPFKNCMSVIPKDDYTSECIEIMKECLSNNNGERHCKCQAMEEYVRKCLNKDSSLKFNGWRGIHLCGRFLSMIHLIC